jgi:hypothetical protein
VADQTDEVKALRLRYEDVRTENKRLHDARSGQLGATANLGGDRRCHGQRVRRSRESQLDHTLVVWALGDFGAMVIVSMLYSDLQPYRKLRDKAERDMPKPSDATNPKDLYIRAIDIEEHLRGQVHTRRGPHRLARSRSPGTAPEASKTLQAGCAASGGPLPHQARIRGPLSRC